MASSDSWLTVTPTGVTVTLYVQPGARATGAAGLHGEVPRVRLAAQPQDGKANAELVRWLARELGIARTRVSLQRGLRSRTKRLSIEGDARELARGLEDLLGST